jgi:acetyl esterase
MPDTEMLHPQVADLLSGILRPDPTASPATIEATRSASHRLGELLGGPGEPVHRIWESTAESSQGPVRLRWYQAEGAEPDSLLVYVHGGGWVAGDLDTHDIICRGLALRSRYIVLSVDYSLAPESIHPRPILEVASILEQARALAGGFDLDIRNLAVAGDSAGAHLLASAIHHLASFGRALPDAAALIYPVTDASLAYPSYTRFAEGFALTAERMRWYWEQYLGSDPASLDDDHLCDPYISPIYSPHLDRFPPSLVITAACDVLHDEGVAFTRRLRQNSVPVEHIEVPGHIHGFLRYRKVLTDPEHGPDAILTRIGEFLARQTAAKAFARLKSSS